ARGCPGTQGPERRVATGFAFGPAGHVVTAAHVVAGCDAITVYWEKHGGQTQPATLARVLARADLALLAVGAATPGPALPAEPRRPVVDTEVETLGYYLSVPTMSNKRLRVTYGSARLSDMVPPQVRRELQQSGAIAIDLDILRLDGHLLPGHSGAPIFDMQGKVVGVGSGGLKSGAASVSWAVPAHYLTALLASQDGPMNGQAVAGLFASTAPDPSAGAGNANAPQTMQASCGGVRFVYTGLRSFNELTVGHEDLNSVHRLMAAFALTPQQTAAFRYHTFQPVDGGAAVAIPDWTAVRDTGPVCRALDPTGRITVDFAGAVVGSAVEAQITSTQFENAFIYRSGRQWAPAPDYSYIGPYNRGDGLTVNRKTAVGLSPQYVPSLAFETLLLHQPPRTTYATFTGVIGAYWDMNAQAMTFCEAQPYLPACAPVVAEAQRAAQMIFGVLLSTAPRI
ncbi:MAG: trypsin-like peptidase domain-containing protein, partial [Alphaproteobacteria bacterium]|nr:trypsin-like peptidase domain-containing protein [Alphaproteobacteria bacterium]